MNNIKKYLYITVGLISLVLGSIGVVLPVLPTTPFLLLSSYCFAKGSERFNNWFINTKLYKNNLESFVEKREMTLKQKTCILAFADFMMMFPLIILDNIHIKIFLVVLICYKFYYFIFKIKTISTKEKSNE